MLVASMYKSRDLQIYAKVATYTVKNMVYNLALKPGTVNL